MKGVVGGDTQLPCTHRALLSPNHPHLGQATSISMTLKGIKQSRKHTLLKLQVVAHKNMYSHCYNNLSCAFRNERARWISALGQNISNKCQDRTSKFHRTMIQLCPIAPPCGHQVNCVLDLAEVADLERLFQTPCRWK